MAATWQYNQSMASSLSFPAYYLTDGRNDLFRKKHKGRQGNTIYEVSINGKTVMLKDGKGRVLCVTEGRVLMDWYAETQTDINAINTFFYKNEIYWTAEDGETQVLPYLKMDNGKVTLHKARNEGYNYITSM